jgi:uncharacterized protein (TIGR02271 family)
MGTAIDPRQVIGHKVVDAEGHKIGQAEEVYLDDSTGLPQWVTVKGGLFGGKEHFAPLDGASLVADEVQLSCPKALVDGAPDLETGRHLSVEEERTLYQHYGLGKQERSAQSTAGMNASGTSTGPNTGMSTGTMSDAGTTGGIGTAGAAGAAGTAGAAGAAAGVAAGRRPGADKPAMGKADSRTEGLRGTAQRAMTRFEERLHIGTEKVETGHARLRKHVETEQVQQTVPVTHQEVRVEREAIRPEDAAALTGEDALTEAETEVTLWEEHTVVTKQNVPVERVRMRVEDVTEEVTVTEEVHTERIDLENDRPPGKDQRPRA